MIVLAVVALVGLGVSFLLPRNPLKTAEVEAAPAAAAPGVTAA
jgi:hypothetical protein